MINKILDGILNFQRMVQVGILQKYIIIGNSHCTLQTFERIIIHPSSRFYKRFLI